LQKGRRVDYKETGGSIKKGAKGSIIKKTRVLIVKGAQGSLVKEKEGQL